MITRLEVNNYRCLRYNSIDIPQFSALVGPNASGKSTFGDAIQLLSDLMLMPADQALLFNPRREAAGRASTFDELTFNGEGRSFEIAVEIAVPEKFRHGGFRSARYEIALGLLYKNDEVHVLNEVLWLIPESKINQALPVQERLFPDEKIVEQRTLFKAPEKKKAPKGWRKVIAKTESGNDYFKSEKTEWNNLFKVGLKRSALANLIEDPEKFPIATWVRSYLREGIESLILNSRAMRAPCGPNVPSTFIPDGSNLPKVLTRLKNDANRFNDWLAQLRTALPDIKNIDVIEREEDKHSYLVIDYKHGARIPSWLVSDGTLRMIALTLIAYLPDTASTYLIEEPENGIHPKALETVIESLSATSNVQVMMATHSPLAIALVTAKNLLCFAKNSTGATDIVSGTNHPVLQKWKGEVPLETLFASGVLG